MNIADRLIVPVMEDRGPLPVWFICDLVRARAKRYRIRLTPHWRATIRNTLQRHCKKSKKFVGKRARFIHHRRGMWECRSLH